VRIANTSNKQDCWRLLSIQSGVDATDNSGVTLLTDSSVTASNGTLTSFGLDDIKLGRFACCYGNQLSLYSSTITFANVNKTYGDVNFDLVATSNSTGSISYSIIVNTTGNIFKVESITKR
jgi:hypothetical protein